MSIIFMPIETTDTTCCIRNNTDNTKRLMFNLENAITNTLLTISTSHTTDTTIILPDTSGTLITNNSDHILTNKTITDNSNYIGADELKTTGNGVIISGSAPPSAGQVLKATSPTNALWTAQNFYFQGYLNVQTTFTTAPTDIPLNVEVVKDSPFTHTANSPEITITVSGNYIISVSASMFGITSNNRSSAELWLNIDTGSGYTEVAGTRRVAYIRQSDFGSSVSFDRYISATAGDKFKVQAERTVGTTITAIKSGQYSMLIKSV